MELTTEVIRGYVGGQHECINDEEGYRYRGQIRDARVEGEELVVEYDYLCKLQPSRGYEPCENTPWRLSLLLASANGIGQGRLAVSARIVNEMSVFYPPDHYRRVLADGTVETDHGGWEGSHHR